MSLERASAAVVGGAGRGSSTSSTMIKCCGYGQNQDRTETGSTRAEVLVLSYSVFPPTNPTELLPIILHKHPRSQASPAGGFTTMATVSSQSPSLLYLTTTPATALYPTIRY